MNDNNLQQKLTVLLSLSFVICLGFVFLSWILTDFDSIPWLTLIISGTFGLFITIIITSRSQKLLDFLAKSESEKRSIALRAIKNNAKSIADLAKLYFESINKHDIDTTEKRRAYNTISSTLKESLTLIQNSIPLLGKLITKKKLEELERHVDILNDLFLILEHGNEEQFINNIANFKTYSNNVVEFLKKVTD